MYVADSWQQIHEHLFHTPPAPQHGQAGGAPHAANGAEAVGRATSPATPSPSAQPPPLDQAQQLSANSSNPHAYSSDALVATPDAEAAAHAERTLPHLRVPARMHTNIRQAKAAGLQGSSGANVPRVLVVAGSDSGGGAGIQADIKSCMACGAYASTAITALTVQNTQGVHGVHTPPVDILRGQMSAVLDDIGADVIKTGMLPDAASVRAVAEAVQQQARGTQTGDTRSTRARPDSSAQGVQARAVQLVVDPVLVSTSGHSLAETDVCAAIREHLLPLATVLTPNIAEASALLGAPLVPLRSVSSSTPGLQYGSDTTGVSSHWTVKLQLGLEAWPWTDACHCTCSSALHTGGRAIESVDDARTAACDLNTLGAHAVLVKGGHLHQERHKNGSTDDNTLVDVLCVDGSVTELPTPRVATRNTHGTGCTLASAIAAHLARGASMERSVALAQRYVAGILAASAHLQMGRGEQGAMDHSARLSRGPAAELRMPPDYRLYGVTDPACNASCGRTMAQAVRAAIQGGVTMLQIRYVKQAGAMLSAASTLTLSACCLMRAI